MAVVVLATIAVITSLLAVFFFLKWQQSERQSKDIRAEAIASGEKLQLAEAQQVQFEKMCAAMEDRFAVLAQQAIQGQSEQHVELANTTIGGLLGKLEKDIAIFRDQVTGMLQSNQAAQAVFEEKFRSMESKVGIIGKEANNLAAALRGSNKSQGDWGEVVLSRALEVAGLRAGEAYETQAVYHVDGSVVRPDVVLHLPEDRHVVIDAKVSLAAYLEYSEAADDAARDVALKEMQAAMLRQVKEIHNKYLHIKELNSAGVCDHVHPD